MSSWEGGSRNASSFSGADYTNSLPAERAAFTPIMTQVCSKLVVISPCWGARFLRFTISTHKGACEWRSPISRTAWPESRPRTKPDLLPGPWCCSWCWCCWWWCCYLCCLWCWWCHDLSLTLHVLTFCVFRVRTITMKICLGARNNTGRGRVHSDEQKFSCYDCILWNVTLLKISNGTNAPAGRPQ